jgi:uncharacterized protein involved in exopolysaccharide biosynthesis
VERDDAIGGGGLPDGLRDPIGLLRRRWRWMAAALLAGLAATAAFVATKQPRYTATATLLVTTQQIREDLVRTTLEDDLLQRIDAMVGEVLSRENLGRLIEKHDPYPGLREKLSMSEIVDRVRAEIVFKSQQGMEARRPDVSARLFTFSFDADRPAVAAGFVNDLAADLVNRSIARRSEEAGVAVSFLRRELEDAEREMREQAKQIREFKEQHQGELPADLQSNLARLTRLQEQRQSLGVQIAEANTQVAELLAPRGGSGADLSPEGRLETLKGELKQKEGVLTERHPDVQHLRREIATLEASLQEPGADGSPGAPTRSGLVAAGQQTVEELRRQLVQTEREIDELDARVERTPAVQEELDALEERETVLRESYRDFLRKVQEAELAANLEAAQQGERFSVLEEAVPPTNPNRSRRLLLAQGCLAALALALGVGILLELVDPVLVTGRQVETESGLQLLGSVPHIS